jgi:hypothetical protein
MFSSWVLLLYREYTIEGINNSQFSLLFWHGSWINIPAALVDGIGRSSQLGSPCLGRRKGLSGEAVPYGPSITVQIIPEGTLSSS